MGIFFPLILQPENSYWSWSMVGLLVIWISYCVQITLSQAILPDIYEAQWCSVTSISSKPFGLYQASVHGIFFRQECWSGLPFPPPGGPPDLGILLHCRWILYFWAIREPWREGFIIDDILALAVPLFLLSSLAAAASLDKHS